MLGKHEKLKLYESLSKLKPSVLSNIVEHLNDNSIEALCECVYNVIHTDLKLSSKAKRKLKTKLLSNCSKKNINLIATKKNALSKKRKALSQEGSGIGLILATVVPFLANLLFNRKKTSS